MTERSRKCPSCGSSDTRFRENRGDWFCDACDHRWAADVPASEPEETPPGESPKAKLFLSYARDDDEPFVQRLYEDLSERGFDVWFDRRSISARQVTFHQDIREAITACDRFVLVVGPKAVTSNYVEQEWRFAYFEIDKCVNPIVRLDGTTPEGERIDAYDLMPEDLKLLHAEDFRDDDRYAEHLENLARQLAEDLPPVGKLVAVPELPTFYREQPDRIKSLRDLLLIDLREPVVVSGAVARVGVQGMGGIGKSVLAAALARRPEVRRAFPDGIFWIHLGQKPDLAALQRRLAGELGDEALFESHVQGKEILRKLLDSRAALVILDDVWQRDHAEAFNVVGPRGRLLLTTRDTGLVTALAATENHYRVELPTMAEAESLLAAAARAEIDALPDEAHAVIEECGRLPLALALCGGMVAGSTPWSDLLAALSEHDLKFLSDDHPPEEQHADVWKAMDVSIRILPEDHRDRFAELAVFISAGGVPEAAVTTLWEHTAGLSPRNARRLLADFTRRSLVRTLRARPGEAASTDRIELHDLLYSFAHGMASKRFDSSIELHSRLLNAYQAKCADGWPSGPNDGYFLEHLAEHLAAAERWDELTDAIYSPPLDFVNRWTARGEQIAGEACLQGVICHLVNLGQLQRAAELSTQLARVLTQLGKHDEAEVRLRRAFRWASGPGKNATHSVVWHELGSLHYYQGHHRKASACYRRALQLAKEAAPINHAETAANLVALATLAQAHQQHGEAIEYSREGIAHAEVCGDVRHVVAARRLLANSLRTQMELSDAESELTTARMLCILHDFPFDQAEIMLSQAWLAYEHAIIDGSGSAEPLFQAALDHARRVKHFVSQVDALLGLTWCAFGRFDAVAAEERLHEAATMDGMEKYQILAGALRVGGATLTLLKGDLPGAQKLYTEARQFCADVDQIAWQADSCVGLAAVHHRQGKPELSRIAEREGLQLARRCGILKVRLVQLGVKHVKANPVAVPH